MEKQSIISIASEYRLLEAKLLESGGEVSEEFETWLSEVNQKLTTKVDACAFMIERFEHDEKYFRAKAIEDTNAARVYANAAKRLRDFVKFAMQKLGVSEITGDDSRMNISTGRKKLTIHDESKIPDAFWKETVIREIDTSLIDTALKNGIEVPGVTLDDIVTLRISPAKPK